ADSARDRRQASFDQCLAEQLDPVLHSGTGAVGHGDEMDGLPPRPSTAMRWMVWAANGQLLVGVGATNLTSCDTRYNMLRSDAACGSIRPMAPSSGSEATTPSPPPLTLGQPVSRGDQVRDAIQAAILDARLPQGTPLVERELSAMLGVSKTPIREALKQLQSSGL